MVAPPIPQIHKHMTLTVKVYTNRRGSCSAGFGSETLFSSVVAFHLLILILPQILLPEQRTPGSRQAAWFCTPGHAWQGSSWEGVGARESITTAVAFE